jgi:predicted peroxiredoxin
MSGKFVVSLTHAKNDTDKATVAFVVANAAAASDKDTVVFLSIEGVRLAQTGFADDIHEEGFAALKDLMASFVEAGGKIFVCSPCFKKRKLDEATLIPGAVIVGGAKLVEFMTDGCPSVSY